MKDQIRLAVYGFSMLIGILLMIYSFLGWRFDFSLFGFTNMGLYFWYGLGIIILLILLFSWGYTIGLYTSGISLLVLGLTFLFGVVLDNKNEVDVSSALVINCLIVLGLGIVTMFLGSEEIHEDREAYSIDKEEHDNSPVVCAQCDQYLGLAKGFESPCPRCNSNRYQIQ